MYRSKGHFIVKGFEDDFDGRQLDRLVQLFANSSGVDSGLVSVSAMCLSCEGNMNVYVEVMSESEAAAEVVNDQLRNSMPKDDLNQASLYVALTVVEMLRIERVLEVGAPAPPPQPPQPPQKPPQPPLSPQPLGPSPEETRGESSSAAPRGKRWTLLLGLMHAALFGLVVRQVAR